MEHVLIERDFDGPVPYDTFRGANDKDPTCFERYRVGYSGSFVAIDDRRMLCHAYAPDAEAVRAISNLHDVPYTSIWTADVLLGAAHRGDPVPGALVPTDGMHDARPYRRAVIARASGVPPGDAGAGHEAVLRSLGSSAVHLFSYMQRGGRTYIGVFDGVQLDEVREEGDVLLWPAYARMRKRDA